MKNAIRFLITVFVVGGLAFFTSAETTVEIAAGETLTITDFKTMDVNGTTIVSNSL
jgi:hypothetical protein